MVFHSLKMCKARPHTFLDNERQSLAIYIGIRRIGCCIFTIYILQKEKWKIEMVNLICYYWYIPQPFEEICKTILNSSNKDNTSEVKPDQVLLSQSCSEVEKSDACQEDKARGDTQVYKSDKCAC